MARTLCIPASALLLVALILSVLVSLSLPFLASLDIVRVNFSDEPGTTYTELRLGIWSSCVYGKDGSYGCSSSQLGYEVGLFDPQDSGILQASWTRGLVVHTIATAFMFIAFLASCSEKLTINLGAFVASFIAALITLVAFIIDIALFAHVNGLVKSIHLACSTKTASGFWLTFISFVLILLANVTLLFGRRRAQRASESASYPMQTSKHGKVWDKFQFNGD